MSSLQRHLQRSKELQNREGVSLPPSNMTAPNVPIADKKITKLKKYNSFYTPTESTSNYEQAVPGVYAKPKSVEEKSMSSLQRAVYREQDGTPPTNSGHSTRNRPTSHTSTQQKQRQTNDGGKRKQQKKRKTNNSQSKPKKTKGHFYVITDKLNNSCDKEGNPDVRYSLSKQ